jgi:xanthine dehydrogenase YagS FAD-binding subunit
MLPSFAYVRPTSLDEALRHVADGRALVHAGGTDLLGCLREGVLAPATVVSLSGIAALRGIEETPEGVAIGALTPVADVAASPLVRERYAALAEAAAQVASPQLRNQGTLGGNVCQKPRCWYYRGDFQCLRKGGDVCYAVAGENEFHAVVGGGPCHIVHPSDTAPALAALGAIAQVAGPRGTRTVPLDQFFVLPEKDLTRETVLAPGEILTRLLLPKPSAGPVRSTYRKVRARGSFDFALVGAAFALAMQGDRVARARAVFGGIAPVPWPAPAVEKALVGRRLDAGTIASAAQAAVARLEPLGKNGYKVPLLRGLVQERLEALARA